MPNFMSDFVDLPLFDESSINSPTPSESIDTKGSFSSIDFSTYSCKNFDESSLLMPNVVCVKSFVP